MWNISPAYFLVRSNAPTVSLKGWVKGWEKDGNNMITDKQVRALPPGMHAVGSGDTLGLKLHVKEMPDGSIWRGWVFRYRWTDPLTGKKSRPELGIGGYRTVSLKQAREIAREARGYLNEQPKRNPRDVWRQAAEDAALVRTFGEAFDAYLKIKLPTLTGKKTVHQWRRCRDVVCAEIADINVAEITTHQVVEKALRPIWDRPETARKESRRIKAVLDHAKALGWRTGDNPADPVFISVKLPKLSKAVKHHAAMPWQEAPAFMARLHQIDSVASKALSFLILTGVRSGEGRLAKWSEIDLEAAEWHLPESRKKERRAFTVGLSSHAVEILKALYSERTGPFIFSATGRNGISEAAVRKLLRVTLGEETATIHGFRASLKTWAGAHGFDREIVELSLAHQLGDRAEQAYRRDDYVNRRRALLEAWGDYLGSNQSVKVVKINTLR